MKTILADAVHIVNTGSGSNIVNTLLLVLGIGICCAIVYGLGYWCITSFTALSSNPSILKVWKGIFIFVGALLLINLIMSLLGHGFVAW